MSSANAWQVLHSVPAEVSGRKNGVVLDGLDFFIAPERASSIAVYRVDTDDMCRNKAVQLAKAKLGGKFRIIPDDTDGEYCTTFICKAWHDAGCDLGVSFEYLTIPLESGNYLLPEKLRKSPKLRLIYE